MEHTTLDALARACGAECPEAGRDMVITGVSTDSRTVGAGDLFVPLTGERFDGHDFLQAAAERGASAALCSRPEAACGMPVLEVADTLRALQAIAADYRCRLPMRIVGITGSVGKTSTKEMVWSVLSQRFETGKTQGNLNNEIGVPLTVLSFTGSQAAGVVEMGMNHFGEMSRLTAVAQPDVAVVTNIGINHIEYLGSREGIARAKLEILEGLRPGGTLIVSGDEPLLREVRGERFRTWRFGVENRDCEFFCREVTVAGESQRVVFATPQGELRATIPCLGGHHVKNALAAAAVGLCYGLTLEEIGRGIAAFQTTGRRQRTVQVGPFTVVDDCYNASPDSMRAAFSVLSQMDRAGKYAALGGMLELGDHAPQAHRDIGQAAAELFGGLALYGENAEYYREGALEAGMDPGRAVVCQSHGEAAELLRSWLRPGDVVLLKGSRRMRMEEVLRLLIVSEDGGEVQ